jgi:hypothetical protein
VHVRVCVCVCLCVRVCAGVCCITLVVVLLTSFPRWSNFYRFKHLLSERYLCVVTDKEDLHDPRRLVR